MLLALLVATCPPPTPCAGIAGCPAPLPEVDAIVAGDTESSRVWIDYCGPEAIVGSDLTITVNGTATIMDVVHHAIPGSADWHGLASFAPPEGFAEGTEVTATLSSAWIWSGGAFSFQVGAALDRSPPSGGAIASVEAVDMALSDDDDPGNDHWYGFAATFTPTLDDEGPAFLLLHAAYESAPRTYAVRGTAFSELVGYLDPGESVVLTSHAIDLAANPGPARSAARSSQMQRFPFRELQGPFLTVREAAEQLRVCTATIYRLCAAGRLPHFRVSNAIRILAADLRGLHVGPVR